MYHSLRLVAPTLALVLTAIAAPALQAQQVAPTVPTRAAADSSPAMAILHGQAAGDQVGTGGSMLGGFAGGFFLGLIGTGIAYAVASGSNAELPSFEAARIARTPGDYQIAFRQGFQERVRARKKASALTGGLLGTAVIVTLVLSASN